MNSLSVMDHHYRIFSIAVKDTYVETLQKPPDSQTRQEPGLRPMTLLSIPQLCLYTIKSKYPRVYITLYIHMYICVYVYMCMLLPVPYLGLVHAYLVSSARVHFSWVLFRFLGKNCNKSD